MYKTILLFGLVFMVLVFVVEYPRWKRTKRKAERKKRNK
jgi:hypothetical protein